MLQKLNERIQGVVAWVVIILITVTFTLFGLDYYMQSRHESSAQVKVNGQSISKQDFELNYRRTRQMRDPALMTAALENQLKKQIIDEMIVNNVSMQSARANGFEVAPVQANSAIVGIPQFQQDGHFSEARYQQALSSALFTPESFQKQVRQGMLLNQQRFAFIGTAFALPNEIAQFVKLYMQTRDYEFMQIPASKFINNVSVTPEEVSNYYKEHQKEFLSLEKVSVDYISLSMANIKQNIKISDEQVSRYYEDNQSNYYTPTQWQVAHILFALPEGSTADEKQRIKQSAEDTYSSLEKDPTLFEQDVKTLSSDKISAVNGGMLPWIVAGQSEFDKALVNLTTIGKILSPVKSQHGYEIFKLIAYKPATIKLLIDVKTQIQDQLLADSAQAKYAQVLEQLSDLSYQTPDSLSPVADALKLTVQRSASFSRLGGEGFLEKNKQAINAAFSHDVLALGNNSDPIQLDNETVVVLRIYKHFTAAERTLADVRLVIEQKLASKKMKALARQFGKQFIGMNQNQEEQDKLVSEYGLKWTSIPGASRDTDTASASINEMAFNLPRVGAKVGRSLISGDYVIVHLQKINDGNLNTLDKEQIASITQQIETNYGMMDYDLYVNDLMSQAKINKDE